MLGRRPEEVIRLAVKGMLPRNRLARKQLTKLKIYAGPSIRTRPSSRNRWRSAWPTPRTSERDEDPSRRAGAGGERSRQQSESRCARRRGAVRRRGAAAARTSRRVARARARPAGREQPATGAERRAVEVDERRRRGASTRAQAGDPGADLIPTSSPSERLDARHGAEADGGRRARRGDRRGRADRRRRDRPRRRRALQRHRQAQDRGRAGDPQARHRHVRRSTARTLEAFFPRETLQRIIRQPLETVGYESRMDVRRPDARRRRLRPGRRAASRHLARADRGRPQPARRAQARAAS